MNESDWWMISENLLMVEKKTQRSKMTQRKQWDIHGFVHV